MTGTQTERERERERDCDLSMLLACLSLFPCETACRAHKKAFSPSSSSYDAAILASSDSLSKKEKSEFPSLEEKKEK